MPCVKCPASSARLRGRGGGGGVSHSPTATQIRTSKIVRTTWGHRRLISSVGPQASFCPRGPIGEVRPIPFASRSSSLAPYDARTGRWRVNSAITSFLSQQNGVWLAWPSTLGRTSIGERLLSRPSPRPARATSKICPLRLTRSGRTALFINLVAAFLRRVVLGDRPIADWLVYCGVLLFSHIYDLV